MVLSPGNNTNQKDMASMTGDGIKMAPGEGNDITKTVPTSEGNPIPNEKSTVTVPDILIVANMLGGDQIKCAVSGRKILPIATVREAICRELNDAVHCRPRGHNIMPTAYAPIQLTLMLTDDSKASNLNVASKNEDDKYSEGELGEEEKGFDFLFGKDTILFGEGVYGKDTILDNDTFVSADLLLAHNAKSSAKSRTSPSLAHNAKSTSADGNYINTGHDVNGNIDTVRSPHDGGKNTRQNNPQGRVIGPFQKSPQDTGRRNPGATDHKIPQDTGSSPRETNSNPQDTSSSPQEMNNKMPVLSLRVIVQSLLEPFLLSTGVIVDEAQILDAEKRLQMYESRWGWWYDSSKEELTTTIGSKEGLQKGGRGVPPSSGWERTSSEGERTSSDRAERKSDRAERKSTRRISCERKRKLPIFGAARKYCGSEREHPVLLHEKFQRCGLLWWNTVKGAFFM